MVAPWSVLLEHRLVPARDALEPVEVVQVSRGASSPNSNSGTRLTRAVRSPLLDSLDRGVGHDACDDAGTGASAAGTQ